MTLPELVARIVRRRWLDLLDHLSSDVLVATACVLVLSGLVLCLARPRPACGRGTRPKP